MIAQNLLTRNMGIDNFPSLRGGIGCLADKILYNLCNFMQKIRILSYLGCARTDAQPRKKINKNSSNELPNFLMNLLK
jgi:hypothetical protein